MIAKKSMEWPFAVIELRSKIGGTALHSAAAFLFDTPDGFAWIEPKYKDPDGAGQHAFHRITATVIAIKDRFEFDGPEWTGIIEPYEPSVSQLERIGYSLEWFESLALDLKKERTDLKRTLRRDLK